MPSVGTVKPLCGLASGPSKRLSEKVILVVSAVAAAAEDSAIDELDSLSLRELEEVLESLDDRIESIRLLLDDRVHEEQLEDVIPAPEPESPFSLLENE